MKGISPSISLHSSRNYRATLQPFLTSFLKPAPFPSGPPTTLCISLNIQGKQRGLECPELALASCLPSFVNDQQQVEQANGESNKPPGSCPPSCVQSVLLLCLLRTWREPSAAISLWPRAFRVCLGQSHSSCLEAQGLLKTVLARDNPARFLQQC